MLNKIRDKSIIHNIFRIQDNYSTMFGFYCIAFIEYTLFRLSQFIFPKDYNKNDKIIYKYFKEKYGRRRKSRV